MTDTAPDVALARALLHEAMELQAAGNLAAAEERYRLVIDHDYRTAEVLPILAGILGLRGANEEALIVC